MPQSKRHPARRPQQRPARPSHRNPAKAAEKELGIAPAPATPANANAPAGTAGSLNEDAVSALVNLGYKRVEAFGAVARVTQRLGGEARLDAVIRAGLQELAR